MLHVFTQWNCVAQKYSEIGLEWSVNLTYTHFCLNFPSLVCILYLSSSLSAEGISRLETNDDLLLFIYILYYIILYSSNMSAVIYDNEMHALSEECRTTLHYTTLHYTTLHYTTLQWIEMYSAHRIDSYSLYDCNALD